MIALDASAVLALLFNEPGHAQVASRIRRSCLSTVNLAEIIGRFARDGHEPKAVLRQLTGLPIELVPFSAADATVAAAPLPLTGPYGLSLADRACLALAITRGIPVLTADKAWANLDVGVDVQLIR